MRGRKPKQLGEALHKIVGSMNRAGLYETARVSAAWRQVAGPQITAHTAGEFLRDRELVVYVDAPVWANELQAMAEQFRAALNEEIGEDLVDRVRFTVSRRAVAAREREEEPRQSRYWEERVEPEPLTEEELRRIEASTAGIQDEALRAVVRRATVTDLEWKKGLARERAKEGSDDPKHSR